MGASDRVEPDLRRARLRIGIGAAFLLALVALAAAVGVALLTPGGSTEVVEPDASPRGSGAATPHASAAAGIYVHVLGAVTRPGLYRLATGSRVVDAVAAAGGLSGSADPGSLNLARPLSDGEQLVVGVQGAAPAPSPSGPAGAAGGKVNLNTADAATLETLPRIGPAMAQRILEWRAANGRFASVEDLLGVTGVGDKTFAGLKDLVTL